jgi:hypothetical protein
MIAASSLGFPRGRIDFPQPAGGRRHHFSGLTQMWASAAETEGAGLQFWGGGGA